MPSEIIRHCRDHTGISPHCVQTSAVVQQQNTAVVDTEFLKSQIVSAVTASSRIDISQLFNSLGELDCTEELDSAQAMFGNKQDPNLDVDEERIPHPLLSQKAQMKAHSGAKCILGDRRATHTSVIASLNHAKSDLRSEAALRARQTTVSEYFK